MEKIQLDVLGLFANKSQETTFTLLLGEVLGYRRLPIMIGMPEAQAIALAIEGSPLERPIMHDLFKEALIKLGHTVKEVNITTLRDDVFFAQLIMTDGKDILALDARPSDAIAIGLRCEAPLFIDEQLLNEAGGVLVVQSHDQEPGLSMAQLHPQQSSDMSHFQHHPVEALSKLLNVAIEREDYEQAALIRDELKRRKA